MVNIDLNSEAEVNALLRRGLLLANKPQEDIPPLEFEYSPQYKRWEDKFLANPFGYAKKKNRPVWRQALQSAAVILLILTVCFGTVMAFNPEARAAVTRWFSEHFQTHDTYRFTGEPSAQPVGRWYPTYLPEGYVESECTDLDGYIIVRFENNAGDKIELNYQPTKEGGLFHRDNEQMDHVEVTVSNMTFFVYQSTIEHKPNTILWEDETNQVMFSLSSFEPCETLIRIAESMELSN